MESNNEEKSLGNECVARLAVIAFSRSFRSRAVYTMAVLAALHCSGRSSVGVDRIAVQHFLVVFH